MSAGAAPAVVVRAPNWLGDTVMAQPALAALRAGAPYATITVVGRWASVLRGQGMADALLDYPGDGGRGRFARALAGARPDVALILPISFEAARAARRWRARRRVGFDTDARGNAFAPTYATSVEGVFAAGDARRGQSLIVWAISEGRRCATAVDRWLGVHDGAARREASAA